MRNGGIRLSRPECDVLWNVLEAVGQGKVPELDDSMRGELDAVWGRLAALRYGPGWREYLRKMKGE